MNVVIHPVALRNLSGTQTPFNPRTALIESGGTG